MTLKKIHIFEIEKLKTDINALGYKIYLAEQSNNTYASSGLMAQDAAEMNKLRWRKEELEKK